MQPSESAHALAEDYEPPLQMRPVPGFEGYYVTNTGRVWSTRAWHGGRGRWLTGSAERRGHLHVRLTRDGRTHTGPIHKLVALVFHGPRPGGLQIRHLNGVETDNRADNLAYGTQSQNQLDAVRHGAHGQSSKTHCKNNHEFNEANTYWRPRGGRTCRECARASDRRTRGRK